MPNKIKIRHGISVKDFEKKFSAVTDMRGGEDSIFKSVRKGTLSFAEFLSKLNPFEEGFTPEQIEQLNNERNVIKQEELKKDEIDAPLKVEKAKIAQEKVKLKSEERRARLSLAETRAHNRNQAPGVIRQFLDAFLKKLWDNAAPYVVLALVLILIVLAMSGGLKGGKSKGSGINPIKSILRIGNKLKRVAVNDARYIKNGVVYESNYIIRKIKAFFNAIGKFFEKLLHPLYKVKKLLFSLTGGAHDAALIERIKIESGRCDNMSWVETTAEGSKGQCDNSVHPIDLTWKLDNTKTPEYFDLPNARKAELDKYSTVKIPWDINPEASFYVPQCEKAYYPQTCTSSGICEKADMFEDLGLSCKIKDDKLPTQYPDADGQSVNTFDDLNNKKCLDIHNLNEVQCH
jgi:hypothetical protein